MKQLVKEARDIYVSLQYAILNNKDLKLPGGESVDDILKDLTCIIKAGTILNR